MQRRSWQRHLDGIIDKLDLPSANNMLNSTLINMLSGFYLWCYEVPQQERKSEEQNVNHSFMCRLAPATFEIIARSGVRWHNAANKAVVTAVLRNYIIQNDIHGLAAHYDSLRAQSQGGEKDMVARFIRSGMHSARQHRELIAKFVALLFSPTPDQPALNYVKKTVFDVDDGGPILGPEHPAMVALRVQPKGDYTILVTAALFLMPDACRRCQRASVDRGKHISRRW